MDQTDQAGTPKIIQVPLNPFPRLPLLCQAAPCYGWGTEPGLGPFPARPDHLTPRSKQFYSLVFYRSLVPSASGGRNFILY